MIHIFSSPLRYRLNVEDTGITVIHPWQQHLTARWDASQVPEAWLWGFLPNTSEQHTVQSWHAAFSPLLLL